MKPLAERFASHWMPEPNTGCWLWIAYANQGGYGRIGRGPRGGGHASAHRLSYELHVGSVPEGSWVLHRCDTPACVNPDHLFLGNAQDNVNDKIAKQRQAKGELCGAAKLTADKVREIRSDTRAVRALARLHGVSPKAIRQIKQTRQWRHV